MVNSLESENFTAYLKYNNVFRVKGVPGIELVTKNMVPKNAVYNERLFKTELGELREFSHSRSKLAALMLQRLKIPYSISTSDILYLGASFGTTVSHLSDMLATNRMVFAIEHAAHPIRELLYLSEQRKNIIPIFSDARNPENYNHIVHKVEFLYCDITQANQAEIFINNAKMYLKSEKPAVLIVKSQSISQSKRPQAVFHEVRKFIEEKGMKVIQEINLSRLYKGHTAFLTNWSE